MTGPEAGRRAGQDLLPEKPNGLTCPVYEAVARALADRGTRVLFGLTGSGNLFIADAFVRNYDGVFVRSAHEAGAVLMARGYAHTSQELGVATVSQGPGLTNAVTALIEAARGRAPVLVIAIDSPVEAKFHWQNVDQRAVVTSTGAGFEQVRSALTVVRDFETAARRAVVEQRPIVLNLPRDFVAADTTYLAARPDYPLRQPGPAVDEAVEQAGAILASLRRPIVLAGRGAANAASRTALLKLATRVGAPVATTLKAKGLFRGERYDLGVFGTLSSPAASDIIARSDGILAFGAGLNYRTTIGGDLTEGKLVIQCDVDPTALGGHRPIAVGIVGDAAAVADQLREVLDVLEVRPTQFCTDDMATQLASISGAAADPRRTRGAVDIRAVLGHLNGLLPPNRVVVTDGGNCVLPAWDILTVEDPRWFVTTLDFGAIGSGMGQAIGASYGAPDRPVLLVTGDGGFTLGGIVEFNTAVREDIDLVVVVCNNAAYGPEYLELVRHGIDPSLAQFDWPDFAAVATALGGTGVVIESMADLPTAERVIRARDRPVLLDVRLDPADDLPAMAVNGR